MILRPSHILILASATLATLAGPYLRVAGPSPLRFSVAAPEMIVLPPLVLADPPEFAATNAAASPLPEPPLPTSPGPKIVTTEPAPASPAMVSALTTPASPAEAAEPLFPGPPENSSFTPQMLIQFFQQAGQTNRPGVSVIAPVSFTPPPVGAGQSSSATYIRQ